MNRNQSLKVRYFFLAAILLFPGLLIVQSGHWHAKSAARDGATSNFNQQRDRDYAAALRPFQVDTDMPGGDYTNFELRGRGGAEECAYACGKDSRCLAFTYVRPGIQGQYARCWLKSTVPGALAFPGVTAGIKHASSGGGEPGKNFVWEVVGAGDCSGRDVGNSEGSTPDNNQAREGYTAVCWDGGTYRNSGRVFCTYKNIAPQQCTGGGNQGVMYRAVAQTSTRNPPPTPTPGGAPRCDNIDGHWFGWSSDNSGASFFINPPNFPINSNRIWAIGGREVVPSDPTHADRWGEWECTGDNTFKLTDRRGQVFNTLTLRGGRLYQADGRYACLNSANCQ